MADNISMEGDVLNQNIEVNQSSNLRVCGSTSLDDDEDFFRQKMKDASVSFIKQDSIIEVVINDINKNYLLVSAKDSKSDGRIPASEVGDVHSYQVGDKISVYVEKIEGNDGTLVLSRTKVLYNEKWADCETKLESAETIDGVIMYQIKSGYIVNIGGVTAFLPNSHIDIKPVQNVSNLIGVKLNFRIIKMDKIHGNIVVSRKAVLNSLHEDARNIFIDSLQVGQILEGKVKSIAPYGVFIEIHESDKVGVVDGLLYIDDISWNRISHPSSVYTMDQITKVMVIGINPENRRIALGAKQLTPNPWEGIQAKYSVGKQLSGRITSIEDYGMFVEIEEGIEGLVHNSEISWTKDRAMFLRNQKVDVKIIAIDVEKHKLALSIKQCLDNPWEKFLEQYSLGQVIDVVIAEVIEAGMVVGVDDNVFHNIRALIRISDITWKDNPKRELRNYKIGDKLKAKVLQVNKNKGKIFLGLKQLTFDPLEEFLQSASVGDVMAAFVSRIEDDGIYVRVKDNLEVFIPQMNLGNLGDFTVSKHSDFIVVSKGGYNLELRYLHLHKDESANHKEDGVNNKGSDDGNSLV